MKKAVLALAILLISLASASFAQLQDTRPLLLRQPTLSRTDVAFMYGNDLWKVSREGGDAIRLTAGPGIKRGPHFSPDGQWIAFTGEYDGKLNVYIISASGGTPRRVTFHAGPDIVAGWTPDGKNILFVSQRDSFPNGTLTLFTVPAAGGFGYPGGPPVGTLIGVGQVADPATADGGVVRSRSYVERVGHVDGSYRHARRDHGRRAEPLTGQRGRRRQLQPVCGVADGAQHLGCAAKIAEPVDSHLPSLADVSRG